MDARALRFSVVTAENPQYLVRAVALKARYKQTNQVRTLTPKGDYLNAEAKKCTRFRAPSRSGRPLRRSRVVKSPGRPRIERAGGPWSDAECRLDRGAPVFSPVHPASFPRRRVSTERRGLFRADLFYRLSGVDLHVPALRLRREDIPELAAYFLARHRLTRDLAISDAALDALRLYDWPGNVRELERLIERAVALGASNRIELDDLPPQLCGRYGEVLGPSIAAGESMRAWGSRYARLVFERCGRNKRAASRFLDISYHTLEAYLGYGYPKRSAGRRAPGWARPEPDAAPPVIRAREEIDT